MNCPFCGNPKTNVVFTGKPEDGKLQRRRFCPVCKKRFNTFERPFLGTPMVVKSDGKREVFDSEKLEKAIGGFTYRRFADWVSGNTAAVSGKGE